MNGRKLLEGFSFVDEEYVDEAEFQTLRKTNKAPWMRWVSAAACICIVIFSVLSFRQWNSRLPAEEISDIGIQQTVQAQDDTEAPTAEGSSVVLRVKAQTDFGFTGTVEKQGDSDLLEAGMVLNVVVPEEHQYRDVQSSMAQDSINAKQDYAEDTLVEVRVVSYEPETGTIYVDLISPIDSSEEKGD